MEIETLAQTWSEHCKHTIFADPMDELEKGIYKTYIKGATEKIRKQKSGKRQTGIFVFLCLPTTPAELFLIKTILSATKWKPTTRLRHWIRLAAP